MSNCLNRPNRLRRTFLTGAMVAGATLGAAGIASAAPGSSTTAATGSSSVTAPNGTAPTGTPPAGAPDPATMTHGPNETLLTGAQLQQATSAATAAVPGATVIRAETNLTGDYPYEVHLKKADGTVVTVELNSSFGVISTFSSFGAGPAGGQAPAGAPAPSTSTTTN